MSSLSINPLSQRAITHKQNEILESFLLSVKDSILTTEIHRPCFTRLPVVDHFYYTTIRLFHMIANLENGYRVISP